MTLEIKKKAHVNYDNEIRIKIIIINVNTTTATTTTTTTTTNIYYFFLSLISLIWGGGQKRCIMGTAKLTNTGQPAHVYKLRDTMQGSDALYCVS